MTLTSAAAAGPSPGAVSAGAAPGRTRSRGGGTVAAAGATLTVDRDIGVRQFIVNSGKLAGSPGLEVTLGGTMIMSGSAVTSVDVATLVVDESATGGRVDLGVGRINVAAGGITAEALVLDILA
jgi:hypothetical protein